MGRSSIQADNFPVMEIRTYTNFWKLERKFYSFFDISLPVPISLNVAGLFLGTGIPWWLLMWAVSMPLSSPWFLIWLVPPGLFAWVGSKPIFEQKTLFQYLATQIVYLTQDKRYKSALDADLEKYDETFKIEKDILLLPEGTSSEEEK